MAPSTEELSAAVAIVLRVGEGERNGELELVLIRRAERLSDPWSGQMGLPGGRWETQDGPLWRTAVRETQEEIGLDLDQAELLGCLAPIPAQARGRRLPISICPFVFAYSGNTEFTLDEEVSEALWAPLEPLRTNTWATVMRYEVGGAERLLPAWDVGGRIVWGLTYAMLSTLFRSVELHLGSNANGG